jgi:hypothetical protein
MRGHSLIYVVVLLGVLAASLPLFVVPVSGHRLSELFRSRTPAAAELTAARKSPRFSARYAKHVHRGRESAHALQSSLWEETKAQAIQDGQFRKKVSLFLTLLGRQKEILSKKRRTYLWCEVEAL